MRAAALPPMWKRFTQSESGPSRAAAGEPAARASASAASRRALLNFRQTTDGEREIDPKMFSRLDLDLLPLRRQALVPCRQLVASGGQGQRKDSFFVGGGGKRG